MAQVVLDSITKRFDGVAAIEDVSLTIRDGETLGVVGPSGCGKTTTLRAIAGFERPTGGRITFDDADVVDVPPEDRNVGLLFQSYALFRNMTVLENVTFGLKMQGVGTDERVSRARDLLEMLDIADLAERNPQQLSGGQQQRVGLARALAPEPDVLLLDEPMTGLDAKLKRQLRTEIGRLLEDLDVTTLYVTHDQEEAMAMCDRIAVLNDGSVEQVGDPEDVYERPVNRFVADFIGTTNLLPATVIDDRLDLGFTSLPAPDSESTGEVTLAVRPEAFTIGGGIAARVVDAFYLGERHEVVLELPDGRHATIKPRLDTLTDLRAGQSIDVGIDEGKIHVLDR